MGTWFLTVELADYWQNEELPFKDKRDGIVARLRSSNWRRLTPYPGHFDELLNALGATADLAAFDAVFDELYDLADSDGIWIETAVVKK